MSQETTKPQGAATPPLAVAIRARILAGELAPGAQLRQEELATQLGVSKIPIREALRQLESEGLVEFKARRGAFVVELTEADILENLEIRIALETHALSLAIPHMTQEDLHQAEAILTQYQQSDNPQQWSLLNSRFHLCLYAPCRLPKLLDMIANIKARNNAFMRLKITQATGFSEPHKEHLALLEACKNKDVEQGVTLLKQHIAESQKQVVAYFRRQQMQAHTGVF